MKYYLYISQSKVDMLFSQIPRKILDGLAGELKINLGLLSTTFKQGSIDQNMYSRLAIVSKYIEHNEPVGSIDNPSKWIKDVVRLRWGPYGEEDEIVYFGGSTQQTVFGFGGSLQHVIGSKGPTHSHSDSVTPFLLAALAKELELPPSPEDYCVGWDPSTREDELSNWALDAVDLASLKMEGPLQRVEILAKKLLLRARDPDHGFGFGKTQTMTLLGTPIYVAMSE